MDNRIAVECRNARRWSLVGALVLHSTAAVIVVAAVCRYVALFRAHPPVTWQRAHAEGLSALSVLVSVGSVVLIAEFLRHFHRDDSPFSRAQSIRLMGSAGLLAARALLDLVAAAAPSLPAAEGAVDLKVVVLAVFLACLSVVVRYGNALKEDSDSIA